MYSPIRYIICFVLSCPLGMRSGIICVLCFTLSCPFELLSSIGCVICFILPCPLGMWSGIVWCPMFYFVLFFWIALVHRMYHMLYIVMSTRNVICYPMCPMFYFVLSFVIVLFHRICHMLFTIRYVIYFTLLCPLLICWVFFMCPTFSFDLSIRIAFPHPMCHMLYIVMSTSDVLFYHMRHMFHVFLSIHISIFDLFFYHMCLMCYFVLSIRISFFIPCFIYFIVSCITKICSFFHVICFQFVLFIPWSGEIFQPDGQNVQSQIVLNHLLWYATPPLELYNIWQFQLEVMSRWTHDELVKKQITRYDQPLSLIDWADKEVFIYDSSPVHDLY
jgi:hypothetical protein